MTIFEKFTKNFTAGRTAKIEYLVIHFVGEVSSAKNNADYFAREKVEASAHYFVDEKEIWRSVKENNTAWHVGAHSYKHKYCRNYNSIGIELCCKKDKNGVFYFEPETIENAIALAKDIMARYGIKIENVLRHYDVTGKNCPEPFVKDPQAWNDFKAKLVEKKTEKKVEKKESEEEEMVYNKIADIPSWAKPTIQKLLNKGFLRGDEKGNIGLNDTALKILVINDRAGLYK